MARMKKLGNPRGVCQWQKLETIGDVKRFFRWCILSVRDQTLETRDAAVLGQLGGYLMRAVEGSDLEARLAALETQQKET